MSRRDDGITLRQMLDHAQEAVQFAEGKTAEDAVTDRALQLILAQLLIVLGEAANRVTLATRDRYPDLPWRDTIDLRNRLIHGYDTISWPIVMNVINHELPPLVARLEEILTADFRKDSP